MSAPFDPARWVASFVELGGFYSVMPESKVWLGWSLDMPRETLDALQQHEALLGQHSFRRAAVKAHIMAGAVIEEVE